jgi:hypothetical protein
MNSFYPAPGTIPAPPPFRAPGELTEADINAYLGRLRAGAVDEDDIYRECGLIDFRNPRHKAAAWRLAHGTHVLDLAAGYDPTEDVRDRPIIAVQLPTPVVARTTGELLDTYVGIAVLYVLDRARRLAGGVTPRVVINASLGYIAGPHDGTGELAGLLEGVIGPRTRAVLPAGNAHLSRCHAAIDFSGGSSVQFDWIVQPDDRTHSIVEVWLPPASGFNRMRMTVTVPDGTGSSIQEIPRDRTDILDGAGRTVGLLEHIDRARPLFRLQIWPTERPQPTRRPLAPAGRWQLTFESLATMDGVVHAWVQRDDSLYGYPQRGRQAYFDHRAYIRFAERRTYDLRGLEVADDEDPAQAATPCPVTRESLFNAVATGPSVITAGGYRERDCRIARYSAGGPNTPPEPAPPYLRKPDALLPSEGSRAHAGVLAAGSRSGARVPMSGTSVAAPQLTRYVADWLAARLTVNRAMVADAAAHSSTCVYPRPPDPSRPPNRCGWGRLSRRDPLRVERFET